MCEKEEKERLLGHLEKAIYRIDKIQEQCNKFDSVAQALDNEDTQLIIAKCFDILYEKIMKFKGYGIAENMYNTLSKYYVDGIKQTRLTSSHDYDDLQFDKIEYLITNDLPKFKNELQNIIDNFDNFELHIDTEIDEINKEIIKKESKIRIYNKEISALKTRQKELQQELNINNTHITQKSKISLSKKNKQKSNENGEMSI